VSAIVVALLLHAHKHYSWLYTVHVAHV
jgi:hypothetical protein